MLAEPNCESPANVDGTLCVIVYCVCVVSLSPCFYQSLGMHPLVYVSLALPQLRRCTGTITQGFAQSSGKTCGTRSAFSMTNKNIQQRGLVLCFTEDVCGGRHLDADPLLLEWLNGSTV